MHSHLVEQQKLQTYYLSNKIELFRTLIFLHFLAVGDITVSNLSKMTINAVMHWGTLELSTGLTLDVRQSWGIRCILSNQGICHLIGHPCEIDNSKLRIPIHYT